MFSYVGKHLRNRKGYTLIELIFVIFILGILATVVSGSGTDTAVAAKKVKAQNDIKALSDALERYVVATNQVPATGFEALSTALKGNATKSFVTIVPDKDPWDTPYTYTMTGTVTAPTSAKIASTGSGTEISIDIITKTTSGF